MALQISRRNVVLHRNRQNKFSRCARRQTEKHISRGNLSFSIRYWLRVDSETGFVDTNDWPNGRPGSKRQQDHRAPRCWRGEVRATEWLYQSKSLDGMTCIFLTSWNVWSLALIFTNVWIVSYSFARQLFSFVMFHRKLTESAKNDSLGYAPRLTAVLLCCGLVKKFALRSYEMGNYPNEIYSKNCGSCIRIELV